MASAFDFVPNSLDSSHRKRTCYAVNEAFRTQDDMIHAEISESILLVGRSGTGKTSIAVGRMSITQP